MAFLMLILAAVCILLFIGRRHIMELIRFYSLARKLPSPKGVPFLGNVEAMTISLSDVNKFRIQTFKEFPRLVALWFGPIPMVLLTDPRDVEILFKNAKRSMLYNFARAFLGDGLIVIGDDKWEKHRKLLSGALHVQILEKFIEVFVRKSEILIEKLGKEVGEKSFDCNIYFSRISMDVVSETILETESHCLEENKDNSFIMAIKLIPSLATRRAISPWLYSDYIYWKTSSGKECKRLNEHMAKDIQEIIRNKRRELKLSNESRQVLPEDNLVGVQERPTFLELLLQGSEYGVNLSEEEISNEIQTFAIAGSDTVRLTLSWAMHLLGNHMDVQEKIYEELENILQGSNRSITMNDLAEMKYLERVVKEVLRLCPAAPVISRAASREFQIGGYAIPAGMIMNVIIYEIHRNPEIYPDPEKFDPDRFLPQKEQRHPYAYIPFSAGPKYCLGHRYAMLNIKTMLSYIIRNYKIYSLRKELTPFIEVTLSSVEGFHISISRRNSRSYE